MMETLAAGEQQGFVIPKKDIGFHRIMLHHYSDKIVERGETYGSLGELDSRDRFSYCGNILFASPHRRKD